MNVFDMFDFDCDGLLSRSEYDAFAIATGDTPPDDECEAFSGDELAIPDIWESLYRLGYNDGLELQHACSFMIEVENHGQIVDTARLRTMTRSERDQILRGLYQRGKTDAGSQLDAHIFTTGYFGMMIVHNTKKDGDKTYRVEITKEENVKWNFYHGKDDIDLTTSGDWILVCSYSATAIDHSAEFHLVEEPPETDNGQTAYT
ncbi:unnamed protein product [Angiostrongylus costaricensis]|uniref:EF-hand domain-containing protein n=1 Tax=Angiostrongylus costaricensis TaxID=334426 RepID=A0A158PHM5_ANGCS|nr:unnamed protein product [Angiostrongylus costaricensis]